MFHFPKMHTTEIDFVSKVFSTLTQIIIQNRVSIPKHSCIESFNLKFYPVEFNKILLKKVNKQYLPAFIDIYFQDQSENKCNNVLIERWKIHYELLNNGNENKMLNSTFILNLFKEIIVILRSIYSYAKIVPGQRLMNAFRKSKNDKFHYNITEKYNSYLTDFQDVCLGKVKTQCGYIHFGLQYLQSRKVLNYFTQAKPVVNIDVNEDYIPNNKINVTPISSPLSDKHTSIGSPLSDKSIPMNKISKTANIEKSNSPVSHSIEERSHFMFDRNSKPIPIVASKRSIKRIQKKSVSIENIKILSIDFDHNNSDSDEIIHDDIFRFDTPSSPSFHSTSSMSYGSSKSKNTLTLSMSPFRKSPIAVKNDIEKNLLNSVTDVQLTYMESRILQNMDLSKCTMDIYLNTFDNLL